MEQCYVAVLEICWNSILEQRKMANVIAGRLDKGIEGVLSIEKADNLSSQLRSFSKK